MIACSLMNIRNTQLLQASGVSIPILEALKSCFRIYNGLRTLHKGIQALKSWILLIGDLDWGRFRAFAIGRKTDVRANRFPKGLGALECGLIAPEDSGLLQYGSISVNSLAVRQLRCKLRSPSVAIRQSMLSIAH
jgi:hypothetical protein